MLRDDDVAVLLDSTAGAVVAGLILWAVAHGCFEKASAYGFGFVLTLALKAPAIFAFRWVARRIRGE